MAKLVSKTTPIRVGVSHPKSVYSRVVSIVANPKPGVDPDFAYTAVMAQNVWLLGVTAFFLPVSPPAIAGVDFRIVTGTTKPQTEADVYAWEDVLPLLYRGISGALWARYHGVNEMSWTMKQLYTGAGRRFGVWARLAGAAAVDRVQVSFEISEG